MALNEIVRYKLGYIGANTGAILCGTNDLSALNVGAVTGLCTDISGNVFASDSVNHVILKIDPRGKARVWAGLAGTWGNNGSMTVAGTDARFNNPGGIACDLTGNVYVADVGNNQIRKIDTNARVSLLAGDPGCTAGYVNGACWSAKFSSPHDVTVVSGGQVYVADTNNNTIRQIDGSVVRTVVGDGTAGDGVGPATSARLSAPYAVGSDFSGKVYISDTGNRKVKVYDLKGNLSTRFSGTGVAGYHLGNFYVATFQDLQFMDVDRTGNVYIVSWHPTHRTRLLKIDSNGNVQAVASYDAPDCSYVKSVAVDRSQFLYVAKSGEPVFESSSSSLNSSSSTVNSSSSPVNSSSSSSSLNSSSSSESSLNSSSSSSSESSSLNSSSSSGSSASSGSSSDSSSSSLNSSSSSPSSVSSSSASASSSSSPSSVSSSSASASSSSSLNSSSSSGSSASSGSSVSTSVNSSSSWSTGV